MNRLNIIPLLVLSITSFASQAKSKWEFRVFNSYSISRESIEKTPLGDLPNQQELKENIQLAATNFSSSEDRNTYIQGMCEGKSEREKIEMARYLSQLSSEIYEYDRADGAVFEVGEVVTNDQQWNAIGTYLNPDQSLTRAGVCRDMTVNVSEFLLNCGIPKECISIESYRSNSGGHQVVQAGCEETYTINWSELYTTNSKGTTNQDLNPNIINSGIEHTTFDPETGEIVGMRQTELGAVLSAVSGGEIDDPNYLPRLLMLEAQYSVMTLGLFKSELIRGDKLMGLKAELEGNPTRWLHLGLGVTYAKNKLGANSLTSGQDLEQDILYAHARGRIDLPKVTLYDNGGAKLLLENNISANGAFSYSKNQIYGQQHWNQDGQFFITPSTTLRIIKGSHNIYYNHESDTGFNNRAYNTEISDTYKNGQHFAAFEQSDRHTIGYRNQTTKKDYGVALTSEEIYFGSRVRAQVDFNDPYRNVKVLLGTSQFTSKAPGQEKLMSYDLGARKVFQFKNGSELETGITALYTPDNLDKYQVQMSIRYTPRN